MPTRPAYSSRLTTTTILSSTSYSSSDQDSHGDASTALTSPDLSSPKKLGGGILEPMLEIMEGTETVVDTMYAEESRSPRRPSLELTRGMSVKARASVFEQHSQFSDATVRPARLPLPVPMQRTRSSSPPRATSSSATPKPRRVPVPVTAPPNQRDYAFEGTSPLSTRRRPSPELKRGQGSTRRMVQQWETLPTTPVADYAPTSQTPRFPMVSRPMSARVLSKDYLDAKPLPVPRATTLSPSSYSYSPGPSHSTALVSPAPASPARTAYIPSPLQHLQTPAQSGSRKRSNTLSPSPSSYSLSPSPGEKKKRLGGRSPLKELLTVFGGGIKEMGRKAKGKGRERAYKDPSTSTKSEESWDGAMGRMGSNGLPGGIVFSDRMGDQEMDRKGLDDPNIFRSSAIMYLIPTPCSSVSPWGSWLSSWATLSTTVLQVTYCPVFHDPKSGHSTPKRVLSGANPLSFATGFTAIQPPGPGITPDVELSMKDCVEVRSLRREETKGRGIPAVPEGVGTEVLEMVWSDGSKRYIGVEGVGGRLGWVSAIWDVLLASKSQLPPALPPPSPMLQLGSIPGPSTLPSPRPDYARTPKSHGLHARSTAYEASTNGSYSAQPVQKVGDQWVAASMLGGQGSDVDPYRQSKTSADLRDSVQRMFHAGSDVDHRANAGPTRRESETAERIKAWQPTTEKELSIFSRHDSTQTFNAPFTDSKRRSGLPKSDTILSFDPNDLNPSRSASQVRRASTLLGREEPVRRYDPQPSMPALDERESESGSERRTIAPTQSSDTTDPSPASDERDYSSGSERRTIAPTASSGSGASYPITASATSGFESGSGGRAPPRKSGMAYPMLAVGEYMTESGIERRTIAPTQSSDSTFPMRTADGDGFTVGSERRTIARTEISHISFPKPFLAGVPMSGLTLSALPMIPSVTNSLVGTGEDQSVQTPLTEHSSSAPPSSFDPAILVKLDTHSTEHDQLAKQVEGVQLDLTRIIASLTTVVDQTRAQIDPSTAVMPSALNDKLTYMGLDIKSIENALQLNTLATTRSPIPEESKTVEMHAKLDNIVKLCEQLLAGTALPLVEGAIGLPFGTSQVGAKEGSSKGSLVVAKPLADNEDHKQAGEEVAQIMADLTGGSNKASPRLGGIQVLHNAPGPASPPPILQPAAPVNMSTAKAALPAPAIAEETTKQVGEVLGLVRELKDARVLQSQQTTDMARYLNELNSWLERFVNNSTSELASMSKRLTTLVGPDQPPPDGQVHPPGLPDLVADMHSMITEQKTRNDSEGPMGSRLDHLLHMMGEDKERQANSATMVDQIYAIVEKQRLENEALLRAVATDLTSEIRGEKMRFIEAMQQATSVNVHLQIEEMKKLLANEVQRSMKELGYLAAQKQAIEYEISDLFALKSKHKMEPKRKPSSKVGIPPTQAGPPPQGAQRGLPMPPPGR